MSNKIKITIFNKNRVFRKIQRDGNAYQFNYKRYKDKSICKKLTYEGFIKIEQQQDHYCNLRLTDRGIDAKKSGGYLLYKYGYIVPLISFFVIIIGLVFTILTLYK